MLSCRSGSGIAFPTMSAGCVRKIEARELRFVLVFPRREQIGVRRTCGGAAQLCCAPGAEFAQTMLTEGSRWETPGSPVCLALPLSGASTRS